MNHTTCISKSSFLKFPTTCILNSNHSPLYYCMLFQSFTTTYKYTHVHVSWILSRAIFVSLWSSIYIHVTVLIKCVIALIGPWKTKWAHFKSRGTFNTELALLWKSYVNEICDLLSCWYVKLKKKILLYPVTLMTQQGLKKGASSHPGQVDVPAGWAIFHSYLPEGQGPSQVIYQLNKKKSKTRIVWGKHIYRAVWPKGKLEFKFFFLALHKIKHFFSPFLLLLAKGYRWKKQ